MVSYRIRNIEHSLNSFNHNSGDQNLQKIIKKGQKMKKKKNIYKEEKTKLHQKCVVRENILVWPNYL